MEPSGSAPRCFFSMLAILGAVLAVPALAWPAAAEAASPVREGTVTWQSPLVPQVATALRPAQGEAPQVTCASYEALVQTLGAYGAARAPALQVVLRYEFAFDQVAALLQAAMEEALRRDDYLGYSFTGYGAHIVGWDNEATVDLSFSYLTTAAQEQWVDARLATLKAELFAAGVNDELLLLAAHDWVVTHVEFDRVGASGDARYTAYGALTNGLAVCQGYSLLMLRLLQAAGLPVRVVPGVAGGEDHAWNLVQLCGHWYHVDATWDDPVVDPPQPQRVRYTHFARTDAQMSRDHAWDSAGFPAANTAYVPGTCAGQTELLSWITDREAAIAAAAAEGKQVLVVAGTPDHDETQYLLETVLQWYWPRVRPLVAADFVVWLCDVATCSTWQPLTAGMGSFAFPFLAVLQPQSPDQAVARTAGEQSPTSFLAWIRPLAPSAEVAIGRKSWSQVKNRDGR